MATGKLGRVFQCTRCGKVVNDKYASTLGTCPNCGVVRIREGKGYPVMPEAEQAVKRGNTKSERG
jgi:predicted  nucleic acid-binding Zn-ribbon protein